MKKREFVMLAGDWDCIVNVSGWIVSEKLDGVRCVWDGGASIGLLPTLVPWSNEKRKIADFKCTGLWSRYGKVIPVPEEWVKREVGEGRLIEGVCMDGELWGGHRTFESVNGLVHKTNNVNYSDWIGVKYVPFDIVPISRWMMPGLIRNPYQELIVNRDMKNWLINRGVRDEPAQCYRSVIEQLKNRFSCEESLIFNIVNNNKEIDEQLNEIVKKRGEGLILRDPWSTWDPIRSEKMLKVKPVRVGVGIVTGFVEGKGKYVGMIGAFKLVSQINGKDIQFELGGGFTDDERKAIHNGKDFISEHYPLGTQMQYEYSELSNIGIPLKARKIGANVH